MVDKRYPNAFKEVNEVLLHTDIDLTNKIPLKFRKFLEENMNKEYDFCIKENLSLEQQGISKEAITKFTFLLSVPVICGATVLKVGDLVFTKEVIVGIITSFAMGILTIKFLLNYIKKHDFSIFAFYRVILALIIFAKLILFK